MSGYFSVGAHFSSIEVSSCALPGSDEPIIRINGFVGFYPTLGINLSPQAARKLAADLLAAVDSVEVSA